MLPMSKASGRGSRRSSHQRSCCFTSLCSAMCHQRSCGTAEILHHLPAEDLTLQTGSTASIISLIFSRLRWCFLLASSLIVIVFFYLCCCCLFLSFFLDAFLPCLGFPSSNSLLLIHVSSDPLFHVAKSCSLQSLQSSLSHLFILSTNNLFNSAGCGCGAPP